MNIIPKEVLDMLDLEEEVMKRVLYPTYSKIFELIYEEVIALKRAKGITTNFISSKTGKTNAHVFMILRNLQDLKMLNKVHPPGSRSHYYIPINLDSWVYNYKRIQEKKVCPEKKVD
jgi:hypothetical protein